MQWVVVYNLIHVLKLSRVHGIHWVGSRDKNKKTITLLAIVVVALVAPDKGKVFIHIDLLHDVNDYDIAFLIADMNPNASITI